MTTPAHEHRPHHEFEGVHDAVDEVCFVGTGDLPWSLSTLLLAAEQALLPDEPLLWRIEGLTVPASPAPALFPLGRVVMTNGAVEALVREDALPETLLARHVRGDWGDLCAEDRAVNRDALRLGQRLLSAYTLPQTGASVWVITEADRQTTTLLLPGEY